MNDKHVNNGVSRSPFYQRLMSWVMWLLIGIIALGSLLDAIANANSILTARLTYWLTNGRRYYSLDCCRITGSRLYPAMAI